jgi:DNA-binding response OmpR family regulator
MKIVASSLKTESSTNVVRLLSFTSVPNSMSHQQPTPAYTSTILVIENDVRDINFLSLAMKQTNLQVQVNSVFDLDTAKAYLLGTGPFANRYLFPKPSIVITNSRFPSGSVSEFLVWLRHHPTLQSLPIVVHSRHDTPEQRGELYQYGANFCLPKTDNPTQLAQQLTSIHKTLQRS